MNHMLADSYVELHAMADAIGLKREWFQPLSSPHYDVSGSKRLEAIRKGAKEISIKEEAELIRRWRVAAKKVVELIESVPDDSTD